MCKFEVMTSQRRNLHTFELMTSQRTRSVFTLNVIVVGIIHVEFVKLGLVIRFQ